MSKLREAMEQIDYATDGEVVTESEKARVVFSARMPSAWSDEIVAEMQRRGLDNPDQLVKALVRAGLDRAVEPR